MFGIHRICDHSIANISIDYDKDFDTLLSFSLQNTIDLKSRIEPRNNSRNLRGKDVEVISIDCNEDEDDIDDSDEVWDKIKGKQIDRSYCRPKRKNH